MQEYYSIPIQTIDLKCLQADGLKLTMARVDEIHKLASGNKIYKLRPIIEYAKTNNFKQIVSFGGAYSNHIHALALMTKLHDIESVAVIRGEAKYAENPTLSDAQNAGMKLEFVSRHEYKKRDEKEYLKNLQSRYPQALIIPEGGNCELAILGCAQMAKDINHSISKHEPRDLPIHSQSDILTIACGTGSTTMGLMGGLADKQRLIAYSVLKDKSLKSKMEAFFDADNSEKKQRYTIQNADFGGYAKLDKPMLDFILNWLEQTNVLLDPIYTGKMCRRVIQQIEAGDFTQGQAITMIHSGGLQGWRGMQSRVESLAGTNAWTKISQYLKIYKF